MSAPTWYILAIEGEDEVLLRCTDAAYAEVPMRPATGTNARALDEDENVEDATDHLRYAPEGKQVHSNDAAPEATHVVNDLHTEDPATQRYMRRLGRSVREAMEEDGEEAPLYVAISEEQAGLFEMVGQVDIEQFLQPHLRRKDLWRETKSLRESAAA